MIYASILKDTLKGESNPINRMYLNELTLNWKKVQSILDNDETENILKNFISQLNIYLGMLSNPKYTLPEGKVKTGFPLYHKIFQPFYIYDLLETILKPTSVLENPILSLKEQTFNYDIKFNTDSFLDAVMKPGFKFNTTEKVYSLCMEMDLNYRPVKKKIFSKDKVNIPIMVFYIVKMMNKYDLYNIHALQHQIKCSNPNAFLAVICEELTDEIASQINSIKPILYILRKITNTENLQDISLDVVLSLQKSILDYTRYKKMSDIDFIHQGCLNPYIEEIKNNDINPEEE